MIHLSHAPTNIVEVEGAPESNPTFLNLLLRFLDVGAVKTWYYTCRVFRDAEINDEFVSCLSRRIDIAQPSFD